jgi:hypothetical protein
MNKARFSFNNKFDIIKRRQEKHIESKMIKLTFIVENSMMQKTSRR